MDFHQKHREAKAMQLLKKRKYKDASKAFEELASAASSPQEKAKAIAYASICLGRQKKKIRSSNENSKSYHSEAIFCFCSDGAYDC